MVKPLLQPKLFAMPVVTFVFLLFILSWAGLCFSQSANVTAAGEVESLRTIAQKLSISIWDFSVDPCSKQGGWVDTNVGVQCSCVNYTCNIYELRLYNQNFATPIPVEVGNFTELQTLKMGLNLFYGSIPPELGKLSKLQSLDLGINQLSGELPDAIANLTNLKSIGIGSNNFSGAPFPLVLTKLTSLTDLYLDHSPFSGQLPPEFGNFTQMRTMWLFGNQFTGPLPDTFGQLEQLSTLRLYGSSIEALPSSFWNLTNLQEMNLGDFILNTVIPSSIQRLQNLTYLSMRNCRLSGSVPTEIGMLGKLTVLDLSFNNLTGSIPDSISNISVLQYLYLSNNSLTGSLPSDLGTRANLSNLDVSNNQLSGALPPWINDTKLAVDLSWNLLNITSSSPSVSSLAFNCPNSNIPCNGSSPGINTGFAVNCGGDSYTSSLGIAYEGDSMINKEIGFYTSPTGKWAVSSGGHVPDATFEYIVTDVNGILSVSDTTLYQTARGSPSSLRYYGLNMENGNYTIELHFAEIAIPDTKWQSNGRRYFDVYIQGEIVLKDFEIKDEANGSLRPIVKTFQRQVRENYIDIHLFWTGRGTCCSPTRWTQGPLISAIRVASDFGAEAQTPSANGTARNIIIAVIVPVVLVTVGIAVLILFIIWRRRKLGYSSFGKKESTDKDFGSKAPLYLLEDLQKATGNFCSENQLGQGAFGSVYKGVLDDGRPVAVKVLTVTAQKGNNDFMNEVATLSAVQHRNLVKLYGCCVEENQHILVFEYMPNNSLSKVLFESEVVVDWSTRFHICVGVARGLAYLHEDSRTKIVHRDIKASNILLDEKLEPKIGDFGLAKLIGDEQTHVSTRIAGTYGYMAPEYLFRGQLTDKADIYSFGILTLELVSGRNNVESKLPSEQMNLLEWTWHVYDEKMPLALVDERLEGKFDKEEAMRLIQIALLCTQSIAPLRPKMSEAVQMLTGNAPIHTNISRPGYLTDLRQTQQMAKKKPTDSSGSSTQISSLDSSQATSGTTSRASYATSDMSNVSAR